MSPALELTRPQRLALLAVMRNGIVRPGHPGCHTQTMHALTRKYFIEWVPAVDGWVLTAAQRIIVEMVASAVGRKSAVLLRQPRFAELCVEASLMQRQVKAGVAA